MSKKREEMTYTSDEMKLSGFRGIGTVWRKNGENYIVVARDQRALKDFWIKVANHPHFDKSKHRKCIVVGEKSL